MSQEQDKARKAQYEAGLARFEPQEKRLREEYRSKRQSGDTARKRAAAGRPINEKYMRNLDAAWRQIFGNEFREEFEYLMGRRLSLPMPLNRDQATQARYEAGKVKYEAQRKQIVKEAEIAYSKADDALDDELRAEFKRKCEAAWRAIFGNDFSGELKYLMEKWM